MKLILVSGSSYLQTSEKNNFISRLATRLRQKGHVVAIVVPAESLYLTTQEIDGTPVFGVSALPVFNQVKTLKPIPFLMESQIRRLIIALKPDVIHIHDHFALCNAFVRVNKKLRLPLIGTNHFYPAKTSFLGNKNILGKQMEQLSWKKIAKVFNQLAIVTAQTERQVALIQSKVATKVIAIPCGIDLDENNPFKDNEEIRKKYQIFNKPILLYVGTIEPADKLEDIINGVALAMKNVDFSFIIIGNGISKPSIETLVTKLAITDNVYIFEALNDADITGFYRLADCFIAAKVSETNRFCHYESHGAWFANCGQ